VATTPAEGPDEEDTDIPKLLTLVLRADRATSTPSPTECWSRENSPA
jgi:hypothetical protein